MPEVLAQQLLLITGSRSASPEMLDYARRVVARTKEKAWKIIVGDADGIDGAVIQACDDLGVPVTVYGAYTKMRRRTRSGENVALPGSYPARDRHMATLCTCCIAIWNGQSRGTMNPYRAARALGKQAWLKVFPGAGASAETTFLWDGQMEGS
jgi:hypothetical protein